MNRHAVIRLATAAAALPLAACHPGHRQSVLHPAAEAAGRIGTLWWIMFAALAAAFALVMTLTWLAVVRGPDERPEVRRRRTRRLVIGGGFVLPGVVLLGMLFYSLGVSAALRRPDRGLRVEVTGHQWWWDVRYPGEGIAIANELYVPAGEPVVVELLAADVIHSFWAPNLHGKIDLMPDMPTRIVIEAEHPGEWRGQCAEFCGRQHAWMAFKVVALPRAEFDAWAADRREARAAPKTPPGDPATDDARTALLRRGEEIFFRESCHACHAVGGTRATALLGPDLTHLGSRLTIGAGRIENTDEQLARWILDPQELKPGNLMPATPLPSDDLAALVAWLRSLR